VRTWAAAAVLVAASSATSATAWGQSAKPRSLEDIFQKASFMQRRRVERVVGEGMNIRVQGEGQDFVVHSSFAPKEGSYVFSLCGIGTCPLWLAVDHGSFYTVRSVDPVDEVAPGLVEEGILERAGRPGIINDSICVRARIIWLGLPARPGSLEGSFAGATGEGRVWGKAVGRPRAAQLSLGSGAGPWPDEALSIRVTGTTTVRLVGGPIERGADGCYRVDVTPTAPLALTPSKLEAALREAPEPLSLAHGTIEMDGKRGAFAVHGAHDGRVIVQSPFDYAYTSAEIDEKTLAVTLSSNKYVYDFDGLSAPLPGAGVAAAVVVAQRMGKEIRGRVYRANDPGRTVLGTFTLR
jgi:hypothetical protein